MGKRRTAPTGRPRATKRRPSPAASSGPIESSTTRARKTTRSAGPSALRRLLGHAPVPHEPVDLVGAEPGLGEDLAGMLADERGGEVVRALDAAKLDRATQYCDPTGHRGG